VIMLDDNVSSSSNGKHFVRKNRMAAVALVMSVRTTRAQYVLNR
jgi:hypothetical protein